MDVSATEEVISYEALMRSREMYRDEAKMLARDLSAARTALKPFADLADVCDHFQKKPDETICSWRISGTRHPGPTADDCRRARAILKASS